MDSEYLQASESQPEIESPQPSAERNSGPEPKRSSSVLTYEHFIKTVHTRLGNDWDISLGICGEEGVGKTSLSVRLGMDLMKMKDHERYLTKHVVYSRHYAEFYDKFKNIKAEQTLSIDEAITLAYKRLWSAEEQVSFNQYLTTAREQRKAVMFLMPHFADFDAYFRHHRLKLWIEVVKRGYAVVFIKDNIAGLADPWHLKENVYTFRKVLGMKKIGDRTLEDELHAYRRYINYLCEFKFDALPENVEAYYKKAKADAREHYAQQDNSKTQ